MGAADDQRPQLDVRIEALVEEMVPAALCDACLAFAFEAALEDVHVAVPRVLQASLRFTRKISECFRCARTIELLTMR